MKTEKKILWAFVLNLTFSLTELIGGIFTGSVAILSDALHDFGDATAIAVALLLEHKSKQKPDGKHTFGYARYSVLGGAINALILLIGSVIVACGAISRLLNPQPIHYDGMIVMAIFGVIVNWLAAWFTHGGHSVNQKAVNLHMLEDVLGWAVVLVGAVVMRFTDFWFIDPLLSIGVAVFIFIHAVKTMANVLDILLEKAPKGITAEDVQAHLTQLEDVQNVHRVHLWTLDGENHCCSAHIVTAANPHRVKDSIRHELEHMGIHHAFLELENPGEHCHEPEFSIHAEAGHHHHHHHHH